MLHKLEESRQQRLDPHLRRSPESREKRSSLCSDSRTGYLCCYCQSGIDRSTSHIEHFRPQAGFPTEQIDYRNFLGSCNCGERHAGLSECDDPPLECEVEEPAPANALHCGKFKGDSYSTDLISPLEPDCEAYFRYSELTGMMKPTTNPTKHERASRTIDGLALNSGYPDPQTQASFRRSVIRTRILVSRRTTQADEWIRAPQPGRSLRSLLRSHSEHNWRVFTVTMIHCRMPFRG